MALPVDVDVGDRVEQPADEVGRHVRPRLALVAAGDEQRRTQNLGGSRDDPAIGVVRWESGLRLRDRNGSNEREDDRSEVCHE